MENEEYISEIDGKFSIDRVFDDKKYNFGVFETFEDALDKLDYLEEEGWPISKEYFEEGAIIDDAGMSLNNIEKVGDKFIIFKLIKGEKVVFEELESVEDAKRIRDNLIKNAWESSEENTRTKYAKYIRKTGGKFVVNKIYNNKLHNFGYFNTFEEALACRDELIADNWGELNIPLQRRLGNYISFNGVSYTIQRSLEGNTHVYGIFNNLEDAIKKRDWLMANNWSKLEVPDDSKKFIHKKGDKFLIYNELGGEFKYFGSYSSLDEAKHMRNKLIENDWQFPSEVIDLKISDFTYYDGEFYCIKHNVDGQTRIYGVYKNKNQALNDEKQFINYDWDAVYTIPTEDYPYGENIVPFDYIFILEDYEKNEIGRYYSFRDVVIARDEIFSDKNLDKLTFSVKIGKSYKNRGWSLIRDSTYDLIPKLVYEDECDIVVDGIPSKAKLNLLPRIFYNKTDEIVNHLEKLANTDPAGRIDVQLLLNKKSIFDEFIEEKKLLSSKILELKSQNEELKSDVEELRSILKYVDGENKQYIERFNKLNNLIKDFDEVNLSVDELTSINNIELRLKIFNIINICDSLKYLDD